MKNTFKRSLALLMALVMLFSLMPANALAEGESEDLTEITEPLEMKEPLDEEELFDDEPVDIIRMPGEDLTDGDEAEKPEEEEDGLRDEVEFASTVASGTCGEKLTWVLYEDGTLEISGTGAMTDFGLNQAPWAYESDLIKTVKINSGATSIGTYAFYQCYNLTNVTIPDSVTVINNEAFYHCYSLSNR